MDDVLVIPATVFKSLRDTGNVEPGAAFEEKARWLASTYPCFREPDKYTSEGGRGNGGGRNYYPPGRRHGANHGAHGANHGAPDARRRATGGAPPGSHTAVAAEKPRIGNRELSLENIARKDFLGILNKLSASNVHTLVPSFAKVIREDFADLYIQLFWDGFLRSVDYQPVHIHLLSALESHFSVRPHLHELFMRYGTERQWMPPTDLELTEDYDDFCDYRKWRKTAIHKIHAWDILAKHEWMDAVTVAPLLSEMVHDFQNAWTDNTSPQSPQLLDSLMEQILVFIQLLRKNKTPIPTDVLAVIETEWSPNTKGMPNQVKFRVYDILEAIKK